MFLQQELIEQTFAVALFQLVDSCFNIVTYQGPVNIMMMSKISLMCIWGFNIFLVNEYAAWLCDNNGLYLFEGRHESEEDSITLDTGKGIQGILREVVAVVCQQNGVPKSRRLGYLNAAVRAISKLNTTNNTKKSPFTEEQIKAFDDIVSDKEKTHPPSSQPDFGEVKITKEQYFCL